MALADEIEELVRRQPGLADLDLVRMLHDRAGSQQQIKSTCRRLVAEGRIERQGRGGWQKPFTYFPPGERLASDDIVRLFAAPYERNAAVLAA
jgi:hypothetical protein